jgi:sugar (pentulose or hexulose) kinase
MEQDRQYLAFDLGASSGRAILGSVRSGRLELEEIHRFQNYPYEKDRHYFWNFRALLGELETGLQKAVAAAPALASFSIDTWGVDYALFRNGELLHDPYCYRDSRTEAAIGDFHKRIPKADFYARNGIQPLVFNTIYQLCAELRDDPAALIGSTMLLMPDALHFMLTGTASGEVTIASTGALLKASNAEWDMDALNKLAGLPAELFTKLVPPGSPAGCLKPETAARLGIPRIPAVKCASHDTASAVLAMPCADPEKALYISLGTWALLGAELRSPILTPEAMESKFTNERGAGDTFRFLCNIMGTWLLQETRRTWTEQGKDISFAEMEAMAAPLDGQPFRIDPDDAVFFPPGDMPERVRRYCREHGQGEIPSDAALVRCIYDSLADCFRKRIEQLESITGKHFDTLNILGGGTRDRFFMRLVARTTGRRVLAGPTEATAIGNILAQMIASGELKNAAEARNLTAKSFHLAIYR